MRLKTISIAGICLFLSGCGILTPKIEYRTIKPEPQWMADCGYADRGGETLGHYKDWGIAQTELLEKCNERQAAEREAYSGQ